MHHRGSRGALPAVHLARLAVMESGVGIPRTVAVVPVVVGIVVAAAAAVVAVVAVAAVAAVAAVVGLRKLVTLRACLI